ncbi:Lrp/AsnC family transcriptional regulator [Roseivirga pacifica]|uniref:Lrp/AsnC family transcriptional regulator n=1 Tax=Roseivirga pacifica TaxID=1267423 RepID=UPI0020958A2E|nr:Lrp/AsnC family transcriptional regulator [Roseivirga pacifica]
MDRVDKELLRLLQENAKLTNKELAAKLGLTITPVHERIKKLEREGFISRYSAIVNRHKVDLGLEVFCSVSLKDHQKEFIEQFERDVMALEEVTECYHIGGRFDYLLKVAIKNMEAYRDFVSQKLAELDNIGNVQSSFVMSEIKKTNVLPF